MIYITVEVIFVQESLQQLFPAGRNFALLSFGTFTFVSSTCSFE